MHVNYGQRGNRTDIILMVSRWMLERQRGRNKCRMKRWDMQRDEESKQAYKEMRREAKKEVAKANNNAYDEL